MANDGIQAALEDWNRRITAKAHAVVLAADRGNMKAAFYCENEAKKNAVREIYSIPIKKSPKTGKDLWKRTALYKAGIGSGVHPSLAHTAMIYASVPYAKWLEYGTSKNPKALYILTNAVMKNRAAINRLIAQAIGGVTG